MKLSWLSLEHRLRCECGYTFAWVYNSVNSIYLQHECFKVCLSGDQMALITDKDFMCSGWPWNCLKKIGKNNLSLSLLIYIYPE